MLTGKSFLTLRDFSSEEIQFLLTEAKKFKKNREIYKKLTPLAGKVLIMIFQKRSTRTRVSAELAMSILGGSTIFLGNEDIHLGVNESIRDTALTLGRMASGILMRVYKHGDIEEMAKYAGIPVLNALSDLEHPLQGLADLLTIQTHIGTFKGKKVAWIGDGNNVCHALLIACAKMGLSMNIASPPKYEPLKDIVHYCQKSANILITNDPVEAITDADVVVTDTFISMGQEHEKEAKLKHFQGYEVNGNLIKHANPNYIFMHCLPRHQEEVTDEIFYGPHSVVFEEAENRLYTMAAVLKSILT
jgi:ornithine carbamoyltransferase